MTLTVEVYEADATTLVDTIDPGQYLTAECTEALNLNGNGNLTLPRWVQGVANPAIALAIPGRVIRFSEGAESLGQFVIEVPEDTVVSPQSEAGELLRLSGGEPLAVAFDKVVWYPDRGLGRLPFHRSRPLSFAADRLRDDDPDGPQGVWPLGFGQTPDQDGSNWFGRGIGYIDTVGPNGDGPEFIAANDSRVSGAPAGVQFFRQRFTLDDEYDVLVQALFDDEGEFWIGNVPMVKATGIYKGGCVQARVTMAAGEHLGAGFVRNLNAERIGVAFAGWSIVDGMPKECLFRSDATTCRVLAYPSSPPGFTSTEAIRLGWDEGQDRGLLTDVTLDFTSAAGTDPPADPMTEVADLTVEAPGSTLLTTCKVLGETDLDLVSAPTGKTLKAFKRGTAGTDLTATHQYGPGNCSLIRLDSDYAEQATVAIVTVDGHPPFEVVHPDAADPPAGHGRIEVALDFGACSPATGARWGRLYLDEISNARRGIALELLPGVGPTVPNLGDTIALTVGSGTAWGPDPASWGDDPAEWTEAHRVFARRFTAAAGGVLQRSVELDQPRILLEERLAMIMRRQLPDGTGGRSALTSTPAQPVFDQDDGSEHTETWSTSATGEVAIRKNGVTITGAVVTGTGQHTFLDPEREYVAKVDGIDFTVDGIAGFPAPWRPPEGRWLLEFTVTAESTGLTIALKYSTGGAA